MSPLQRSRFETVVYEKKSKVAWLALNRPTKMNAYNTQMRDDLWEALYAVDADPEIRAVVLHGRGPKGFCAGADLTEFGTAPSQVVARQVRWERDVFGRLYNLSKPTVAALHGYVIGSGVELALLCDLRVAAADARFRMPETSLGLIPAAGGTQTLARWIGRAHALEMVLQGVEVDASHALRIGLVDRLVTPSRLTGAAGRLAAALAALPPEGAVAVRQALRATDRMSLNMGLLFESRLAARLAASTAS